MLAWIAAILIVALALLGLGLLCHACGRRRIPDGWDAEELRRSHGDTADGILAGKAWLETKQLQPVEVASDDELTLRGMFLARKNAKGTVLLFHDCRSSWKLDFSPMARFFYEQGFQLLLADQRAHGASGGRHTTYGIWERFDVRAWSNYMELRFGAAHPLFPAGLGMGAAAVLMASSLDLPGDVRGIIAMDAYSAPYRFLEDLAEARLSFLAWPMLGLLNLSAAMFAGFSLKDYSAAAAVAETEYPILLIHGTGDQTAPCDVSKRLGDACRSGKCLLLVEGAGHGKSWIEGGKQLEEETRKFLEECLRDGGRG